MAQRINNAADATLLVADLVADLLELFEKRAYSTTGIGYASGDSAGSTVTQATSKGTSVTINKLTGRITMNAAALAAGATVAFDVSNSSVGVDDFVGVITAGSLWGNYSIEAYNARAGAFTVRLTNRSAGSLSEAVVLNFVVIKGATT